VSTISRRLKNTGLFCKRARSRRLYSAKETYNFKKPTNRSHPVRLQDTNMHTHRLSPSLFFLTFSYHRCHSPRNIISGSVASSLHPQTHTHTHTHTPSLSLSLSSSFSHISPTPFALQQTLMQPCIVVNHHIHRGRARPLCIGCHLFLF